MNRRHAPLAIPALAAILALSGCGSSASYSAKVVSYQALDPAHLGVTIQVKNTGSSAGTPSCLIQGNTPDMSGIGTDDVTLDNPLQPGQSVKFADSFVITDQDAGSVSQVTVSCT
jgi:hypothetical protein